MNSHSGKGAHEIFTFRVILRHLVNELSLEIGTCVSLDIDAYLAKVSVLFGKRCASICNCAKVPKSNKILNGHKIPQIKHFAIKSPKILLSAKLI
jgi:hypothetical protein